MREIIESEPRPYERRVYWFQCPSDLYDQDFMVNLELLENGDRLQNIAIKLFCFCVASAPLQKEVGQLKMKNGASYTEGILAKLLRVDLDHMRVAMKTFQDLCLVHFDKEGTLNVPWIKTRVDSLAASSIRAKKTKDKQKAERLQQTIVAKQQRNVALQPRSIDRSLSPERESDLDPSLGLENELRKTEEFLSALGTKKRGDLGRLENL